MYNCIYCFVLKYLRTGADILGKIVRIFPQLYLLNIYLNIDLQEELSTNETTAENLVEFVILSTFPKQMYGAFYFGAAAGEAICLPFQNVVLGQN